MKKQTLTLAGMPFTFYSSRKRDIVIAFGWEDLFPVIESEFSFLNFPLLPKEGNGRGQSRILESLDGRKVVLRPMMRGGMFGGLLKDKFFFPRRYKLEDNLKNLRPLHELRGLAMLSLKGISCALPVAAVIDYQLCFYKAALITEYIEGSSNLLRIIREGERERVMMCAEKAGEEARKALTAGIFHPDLHPGNVLCTDCKAVLIDFDKWRAVSSDGPSNSDYSSLQERWSRFVYKYDLPLEVGEAFDDGLFE